MKADTVSTLTGREILRTAMARNQTRLNDTLKEFSTGRHADIGRTLGSRVGGLLDMRDLKGQLEGLTVTNGLVAQRLQHAQSSLTAIHEFGNDFLESTLSVHQGGGDRSLLVVDAKSKMGALVDTLSSSSNGIYIFSGLNTSEPPVDDYLAEPPGTARTAVIAAFTAEFGFPPDDPQAANITPAAMQAYLDGPFTALFEEPSWSTNFSSASDEVMRDRISHREEIDGSATANDVGFRKMYASLVLAIDGGAQNLNADTFDVMVGRIEKLSGEGIQDLVDYQSRIGVGEERLAQANDRIGIEQKAVDRGIGAVESVDPFEVADRLSLLMTRIESSYAVTARMQQLTLLNYL